MAVISIILFALILMSFAATGLSIMRAMPRIDAVIVSRGEPKTRTIRIGTPRSGWTLA
jgi:hypothetical protein